MAEHDPAPSQNTDLLELKINSHFDRIIDKVNARRFEILTEVRERRGELRTRDTLYEEMISQITATKSQVESGLRENPLKQVQQKMINELEKELEKLKMTPQKKELQFSIDSNLAEQAIEKLGKISEVVPINYDAFQPVITVVKKGKGPGELDGSVGLAVNERSGNIFIAEFYNSRVSIFSQTGEYIRSFGTELFNNPWGIAMQNDNLYVGGHNDHVVFSFKLPDLKFIRQVGKKGPGNLEFQHPSELFISQVGDLYVCDRDNDRIQVLTSKLKFKKIFKHDLMTRPVGVKLTEELMYVLSHVDDPCVHVFTLTGDKIRSVLSRGKSQLNAPWFFCIDSNANIVISACNDHCIKVFTPDGEFLHQIGQQGHEKGMFSYPGGISFTKEGSLICVSNNENFSLQIFL